MEPTASGAGAAADQVNGQVMHAWSVLADFQDQASMRLEKRDKKTSLNEEEVR